MKEGSLGDMITRVTSAATTANSYLVTEGTEGLLLDASDPEEILRAAGEAGVRPEKILLTHEHVDHIFGLETLRRRFAAPVTATSLCSSRIGNRRENLSVVYDMLVYAYTGNTSGMRHTPFICAPCEEVFAEEMRLDWHGHTFLLNRCPGHSPGSCVIRLDEDAVFTGDYLLPDMEVNLTLFGSDPAEYETVTLPWLRAHLRPGMTVYPGHGEPYVLRTLP